MVSEKNDRVMLIALDTNLETEHPFDIASGELGENQLSALNTILVTTENMIKMLFFHHHLFIHNNPFMELKDVSDLMRVIFNRVDVILFGHRHVSKKWENTGGLNYIFASDDSLGKNFAREITIEKGSVTAVDLQIAESRKRNGDNSLRF